MEDLKAMAEIFGPWGAIVLFTIYLIYQSYKERSKIKKEAISKADEIEHKRALTEQLQENASTNKEILKYLKISSEKYADEINESQARIVIESVLSNSENDIKRYTIRIIKENHIMGHEKETSAKLKSYISNRYHKDTLILKEFKLDGKYLIDFLKSEWRDYVTETVTELVINEKGAKAIASTLENAFESFKWEMIDQML